MLSYGKPRMKKASLFFLAALGLLGLPLLFPYACSAREGDKGLAQKPYMGWSSWSFYKETVTEAAVKAQADVVADKLKPCGYTYINIDDGWEQGYDDNGYNKANSRTFPDGIASLADYVHKKGLKLGIYLIPGIPADLYQQNPQIKGTTYHIQDITDPTVHGSTRRNYYKIVYSKPGAAAYIQGYADLLASWGVDFIKMDFVGPGGGNQAADNRDDLQHWSDALNKTGRPFWLELSNSLKIANIADWQAHSNGWRIGNDVERYNSPYLTLWSKIARRFTEAPNWVKLGGPGGWNDFDSLEIGNGDSDGLTVDERHSAMTLWAISCSPLYSGADLTHLDPADYAMLTNKDVIQIDQAGRIAVPLSQDAPQQVWWIKNADGSLTVALFNLGEAEAPVTVNWSDVGLKSAASVTDLWSHADLGKSNTSFTATLSTHGCRLLRVK
jgi:alpha-galactosidase